jgi:ribosomal protein S18 acetylase RimI-like enzyme
MVPLVRAAQPADLPAIARLAGELVRLHHGFDADRFMSVRNVEAGYARWFAKELDNDQAVLLAAEGDGGEIVGYAYGRLEPRDWNALLDAHGGVHDVFVAPEARQKGVARRLLEALVAALVEKGAPRVLLHTATANRAAQRLFRALGFRETMIEMTYTPPRR